MQDQKEQEKLGLFQWSIMLLIAAVPLWVLTCVAACIWLKFAVHQTPDDFALSSWLIPPFYFGSPAGPVMGSLMMVVGVFYGFILRRPLPLLLALTFAPVCFFAPPAKTTFQIGLAQGWVKVGCYNYDSVECRKMLGAPGGESPSLVSKEGAAIHQPIGRFIAELKSKYNLSGSILLPMPGMAFFYSPFFVFQADEINAKLTEQRAEVAAFRKSHPAIVTGQLSQSEGQQ